MNKKINYYILTKISRYNSRTVPKDDALFFFKFLFRNMENRKGPNHDPPSFRGIKLLALDQSCRGD